MHSEVLEFKCPCCDAGLVFSEGSQRMKCHYCDNEFDLDTVREYNESLNRDSSFTWEKEDKKSWKPGEEDSLRVYICPSCSGQIMTDANTAATFCPYCGNPTVLSNRLSGGLKPDGVIPFKTGKEDAKAAFLNLCKGKPLLPKLFTQEQQLEKLTGIYVPFWLYDCDASYSANYKATRVRHWSDANFTYTKTDHFRLHRCAEAEFSMIPMDGSKNMDDAIMESIEPYDYSQLVPFETAYLSGFFADKYDVEASQGEERIRQRVSSSMETMIAESLAGYTTKIPTNTSLNISRNKAKYVLLPVWMLSIRYQDQSYTFAMNGQTGKMTGTFPICPKRTAAWFAGIFAAATAISYLFLSFFF